MKTFVDVHKKIHQRNHVKSFICATIDLMRMFSINNYKLWLVNYPIDNSGVTDVTFSAAYSQTLSSTVLVRYIEKNKRMGHTVW